MQNIKIDTVPVSPLQASHRTASANPPTDSADNPRHMYGCFALVSQIPMLVASRFYRYFAGNVNTGTNERTPLIQPVIAHAITTTKNGDASRSTECNHPGSSNTDAAALPSYSAEEVDTPQYSYFPEPSHATSSTAGALPNYQLFGLETKEILGLPENAENSSAIRTFFRTEGAHGEHPMTKIHDRYRELDMATRALKMSQALRSVPMEMKRVPGAELNTMEVGLVWDPEPSTRFLDQIHKDMLGIKAEHPDTFEKIAEHLLEALPALHKEIFSGSMSEHPVFELAVECFAQHPDRWLDTLLQRDPQWLVAIASNVSFCDRAKSANALPHPVSSRLYAIINGEPDNGKALTGDKALQAQFALLDAAVEDWKDSGWRTPEQVQVLYGKVRDRANALQQKAATGQHWSNLFHVWANMAQHISDEAEAKKDEIKHDRGHWKQTVLQPLLGDIHKFVDSAVATRSVNILLDIARTCVERLLSTKSRPLIPAAQLLFLEIADLCASRSRIWNDRDTDVDHQLLVDLKSSVEQMCFRAGSSREKVRSEISSSLGRLAYWCLYYSLEKENWNTVELLKKNGIDFRVHSSDVITTSFHSAVQENQLEIIRKMIELKVDVNAIDLYTDETALHKVQSVEAIELLHDAGAKPLALDEDGNLPSAVAKSDAVRNRLIELENATPSL